MVIENDKVVSISYVLKDENDILIDESKEPLDYIHGHNMLIKGLEKQLEGKSEGESFSAVVPPEEAYGIIDKELIVDVPRDHFPSDVELEVGMMFETDDCNRVAITAINGDKITVDANHELAGKTLYFDVTVAGIRDATPEELQRGLYSGGCGCGGGCGGCGGSCGSDDGGCGCGGCGSN